MTRQLIGTAKIRNLRRIYRVEGGYEVEHIDRRGIAHVNPIPEEAVDRLHTLCLGETLGAEEAASRLAPYAEELGLPFHYGDKLRFLVQEMLLVLEVQQRLKKRQQGNQWVYQFIAR